MHPDVAEEIANSVDPESALFAQAYLSKNLGSLRYLFILALNNTAKNNVSFLCFNVYQNKFNV